MKELNALLESLISDFSFFPTIIKILFIYYPISLTELTTVM